MYRGSSGGLQINADLLVVSDDVAEGIVPVSLAALNEFVMYVRGVFPEFSSHSFNGIQRIDSGACRLTCNVEVVLPVLQLKHPSSQFSPSSNLGFRVSGSAKFVAHCVAIPELGVFLDAFGSVVVRIDCNVGPAQHSSGAKQCSQNSLVITFHRFS